MTSPSSEILQFLDPSTRKDVLNTALNYLHGVSGSKGTDVDEIFSADQSVITTKLIDDLTLKLDLNCFRLILDILINLTAQSDRFTGLFFTENGRKCVTELVSNLNRCTDLNQAAQCSKLLTNLTRDMPHAEHVVNDCTPLAEHVTPFISHFMKNSDPKLDYVGYVILNLTQSKEFRFWLVHRSDSASRTPFDNFVTLLKHKSVLRRQSTAETIKNCCFDSELHEDIIGTIDFAPQLLMPLAGPEEFDDEDNEKLPLDLQYLEYDKIREPVLSIRLRLLEAIYQLCSTRIGREFLRKNGTYLIMREYHKWEKAEEEAEILIGNIIGVMIRTEDEIGADDLKQLGPQGDSLN